MYSMMLPFAIHSDTMENRCSLTPSNTPISFRILGWDNEFQMITSLQNRFEVTSISRNGCKYVILAYFADMLGVHPIKPECLHCDSIPVAPPLPDICETT